MKPKLYPDILVPGLITQEMMAFLFLRAWLIARFGVTDEKTAQAAIHLYRQTLDRQIVQIHVRQATADGRALSFVIPDEALDMMVRLGLWRWRYKSLEESTGSLVHPKPPVVLRAWGSREGGQWCGPARSVFFATTTKIGEKEECNSFFLVRRDGYGQWRMSRAYLLDCLPDSQAWLLGSAPLTAADLPGASKLGFSSDQVELSPLLVIHDRLISGQSPVAFRRSTSAIRTGDELIERIDQGNFPNDYPDDFAFELDRLLAGA